MEIAASEAAEEEAEDGTVRELVPGSRLAGSSQGRLTFRAAGTEAGDVLRALAQLSLIPSAQPSNIINKVRAELSRRASTELAKSRRSCAGCVV